MASLREIIQDPATYFATPIEVLENPQLSAHLKEAILKKWEKDEQDLQRAGDEGMPGPEGRLSDVSEAMSCLRQGLAAEGPGTN